MAAGTRRGIFLAPAGSEWRDAIMRRFAFLALAGSIVAFSVKSFAQYQPPAGYELIPLVDSSGNGLDPQGLAVNSSGEMAVTNGDTVTLYNTWQNGRTAIATATDSSWLFDTDPVFLNNSTILFAENGNTDALWSVNFATTTPTITQITPDDSLPFIEGVAVLDSNHALVSGQNPAPPSSSGALYLDSVNLTSGSISSIVTNVGTGYPGNPAVTPGGHLALLEGLSSSGSAFVHLYTSTGTPFADDNLANGNGSGEAYGIAFDSSGNAYITTDNTITLVSGIDTASPVVSEFGTDNSFAQFLTSISFIGGAFNPGQVGDTGALIVNDADGGGAFAIVVPEPASLGALGACALLLAARRRERRQ
jgi:hypothetical protein